MDGSQGAIAIIITCWGNKIAWAMRINPQEIGNGMHQGDGI